LSRVFFYHCPPPTQELFDDFDEAQRGVGEPTPSYTYFTRTWKENRRHIKPKTGGEFMKCYECTVYKDTLFGSPGIKPSKDPAKRASVKLRHDSHLKVSRSGLVGI
jgi:hypothetical protein